jgi:hypothetical protein
VRPARKWSGFDPLRTLLAGRRRHGCRRVRTVFVVNAVAAARVVSWRRYQRL